jgi:hypothetical protein
MKSQDLEEKIIIHNLTYETIIEKDLSKKDREIIPESFKKPTEITPEPPRLDKIIAWCLPATVKEVVNPLYGEVKRSIVYGEKFSFEIVVRNRGLVTCDFLAPLDISIGSIVYLWSQREWWQVTKSQVLGDSWLLTCYPSEKQPSFQE